MSSSVRVLLVDEDVAVLDITQTFLERADENFQVHTATSVEDAIEAVREDSFDAVVSDYKMPRMNGIDLAAEIHEHAPDVPYFLFTAKEGAEFERELESADVTGYVQKGTGTAQYEELAEKINQAL